MLGQNKETNKFEGRIEITKSCADKLLSGTNPYFVPF